MTGRNLRSLLASPGFRRLYAVRLLSPSSYLMKSPPVQRPDDEGRAGVEAFIRGEVER